MCRAALGMAAAKNLQEKKKNNCVAVIGDGAITGGMAYEAMNNAAYINSRVIVILNDNGQVSLPTGQPSAGGVIPAGACNRSGQFSGLTGDAWNFPAGAIAGPAANGYR